MNRIWKMNAVPAGLIALILTFQTVSWAHFNPAVTIGFYVAKRFPANLLLPYIASQFAGVGDVVVVAIVTDQLAGVRHPGVVAVGARSAVDVLRHKQRAPVAPRGLRELLGRSSRVPSLRSNAGLVVRR